MKKLSQLPKSFYFVLLFLIIIYFGFDSIRSISRDNLPDSFKRFVKTKFFGQKYLDEINFLKTSNYNQKILPESNFVKISFKKKKILNLKSGKNSYFNLLNNINDDLKKKFFIVDYNDEIILVDSVGTIIKLDHSNNFQESIVRNNIKSLGPKDIKDAHILGNNLFISILILKKKIVIILESLKQKLMKMN